MGVRLESKSCIEKTSNFGSEKFRISLGHQAEVSNFVESSQTIGWPEFPPRSFRPGHVTETLSN